MMKNIKNGNIELEIYQEASDVMSSINKIKITIPATPFGDIQALFDKIGAGRATTYFGFIDHLRRENAEKIEEIGPKIESEHINISLLWGLFNRDRLIMSLIEKMPDELVHDAKLIAIQAFSSGMDYREIKIRERNLKDTIRGNKVLKSAIIGGNSKKHDKLDEFFKKVDNLYKENKIEKRFKKLINIIDFIKKDYVGSEFAIISRAGDESLRTGYYRWKKRQANL